jgi:hypothetical protein
LDEVQQRARQSVGRFEGHVVPDAVEQYSADLRQLAAVYSVFTEGVTMPDLQAARSVVEQR